MKTQSTFAWSQRSPRALSTLLASAAAMITTTAHAESYCWTNSETGMFDCFDPETDDAFSVTGNIPPAASPDIMFDGLRYQTYTSYSLDLVASGRLRTSDQFDYPVLITTWGDVSFDARGSEIISEGGSNVALRIRAGDELEIWGGSVRNDGAFAYGIAADAGHIVIHGGRTVVGHTSVGIYAQSNYGDAIVYTGHIDARQFDATGAVAFAKDWGDGYGCGTAIVNVNGSVIGAAYGVRAMGCANTEVNVANRGRVAAFGNGTAVQTDGTGTARVTVDGTVIARALGALAVDQNGQSSVLTINSGGLIEGRYNGTEGADIFAIGSGGTWQTRGENDFGSGNDLVRNEGDVRITYATSLEGLERFENWGRVGLTSTSLALPWGVMVNRGFIDVSGTSVLSARRAFINGGLINLTNGTAGDRLLITNQLTNLYNSRVALDVGSNNADLLSVNGVISGQMLVDAFLLPDAPKILLPTLLITAAQASDDAFALGKITGSSSPLMDYRLFRDGDGFYLTSVLSQRAAKPLLSRKLESRLWRSNLSMSKPETSSRDANGWTFQSSVVGSNSQTGSRETSFIGNRSLNVTKFSGSTPLDAKFSFSKVLGNSDWFVGGNATYLGHSLTTGRGDSVDDGISLQGVVGLEPEAHGWHGSLSLAALSFNTNFADPEWSTLKDSPRTTSTGLVATAGYRHQLGSAKVDWNTRFSLRHVDSSRVAIEGIRLHTPSQNMVTVEAGGRLNLGGSLNPTIDVNVGSELGRRPDLDANVEGKSFRFDSNDSHRWIQLGLSLSPARSRTWAIGMSAEISDQSEGSIAGTFRF